MEEKIDFTKAPYQYPMCLSRQCPKANTCLRQLLEQNIPESVKHWMIISPKHLITVEANCPYYRPDTKVQYAKGFIGILDNIPHKQMQTVISHLMNYLGRRTYYRSRKGERLLSPSEQQQVLNILKSCGVTHPQAFDAYIEEYDW